MEHICDILAFVSDLESLAVVAFAPANLAFDVNVGQEVHLDFDQAAALAILTTAAFDIETESTCVVTADPRCGQLREQFAYRGERAGVCDRIRSRRPPDGALVNHNYLVDLFQSANRLVSSRLIFRVIEMAEKSAPQNIVHQRRFAAAGNASHTRYAAERK